MFNVLSLETLQRKAPSIFAQDSAERTSDKYRHISTAKVVEGLIGEGFMPTWVKQSNCRLENKKDYTKHMIRFRHIQARPTANDLYPEIVLINSHDGLSSYRLVAGIYRMLCSNGLVAGNDYAEVRVRHQGDIVNHVIEGTYEVVETAHQMLGVANKMEAIELTIKEQKAFAETAHELRFEDSEIGKAIKPTQLLEPRRYAERGKSDLFTTFNVVQENLLKGGVRGFIKNKHGYPTRRTSTRAINSIDQSTALNRALWTLAEKMMQLKGVN